MIKKTITLVLCAVLCITVSSCSEPAEDDIKYGEFGEVEISQNVTRSHESNEEEKIESTYYDEWRSIKSAFAKMKFSLPALWDVQNVNARYIKVTTPENDPHLPDLTLNIIYHHHYFHEAYHNVDEFDSLFKSDISGLQYTIDNEKYHELYAENVVTSKYADTELKNVVTSCNVIKNVHLGDGFGYSPRKELTAYHYSIAFNGVPMQIRTVVTPDKEADLKTILYEIASSINKYEYPVTGSTVAEFENISINLPQEFKKERMGGTDFYIAPSSDNTMFSGIMVYEAKLPTGGHELDKDSFAANQIPQIAATFMPASGYDLMCEKTIDEPYSMSINGEQVTFIYSNVNYFAKEDRGASFYGNEGNALVLAYLLPTEKNTTTALCIYLLQTQEDAMSILLDCANQTLQRK